jgi:hypothetical protein
VASRRPTRSSCPRRPWSSPLKPGPQNGRLRREGESPPFAVSDVRGSRSPLRRPLRRGVSESGTTARPTSRRPRPAGLAAPLDCRVRATGSRGGSGSPQSAPRTGPSHAHSACACAGGEGRRPRPRSTLRTRPGPTRARAESSLCSPGRAPLPQSWLALSAGERLDCRATSLRESGGGVRPTERTKRREIRNVRYAVLAARPPASSAPRGGPMRRSLGPPRNFVRCRP